MKKVETKNHENSILTQEKAIQGAAHFDQSQLKKATPVQYDHLAADTTIQRAAGFDQKKLNHVEPVEKTVLPSTTGYLSITKISNIPLKSMKK